MKTIDTKELALRVRLPFGEKYKVRSIANDIDHIGNWIADGYLHPSMFWPELAKAKAMDAKRARSELLNLRTTHKKAEYAAGWIDRMKDDYAVLKAEAEPNFKEEALSA